MQIINFFKKRNFWLALGLGIVLLRGLALDVMDVDATQYASIGMEMLKNGSFLQVFHRGEDYLDKPPLVFWTAATSFFIFGLKSWAYKLPSFLVLLMGILAVFRFTEHFYGTKIARHAAFILASALGFNLLCNDVRTDSLLFGTTACAVWQWAMFLEKNKWSNLFAGAFFVGLAMLAKGPIGLVMPCFAVGTQLLFQHRWRQIFDPRWLMALLLIGLILLPMCWGLYHQFDLHPDKPTHDRNTHSGLYFYFWEQSFGRVTGENVWENDSTPVFFVHTYLWAFLPWGLIFWGALLSKIDRARQFLFSKNKAAIGGEWYSLGGFLLTFIALSMSRYKLPHYIFITLPYAAVMTADFVNKIFSSSSTTRLANFWAFIQYLTLFLVTGLSFMMIWYIFPTATWWIWGIFAACFGTFFLSFFTKKQDNKSGRLVKQSVLAAIGFGAILNFWFYPNLLPYQSTAAAGRYLLENKVPETQSAFFVTHGHALDFYGQRICKKIDQPDQVAQMANEAGAVFLYTDSLGLSKIEIENLPFSIEKTFNHFQVARLNLEFLNPATRETCLAKRYILKILAQPTTHFQQ